MMANGEHSEEIRELRKELQGASTSKQWVREERRRKRKRSDSGVAVGVGSIDGGGSDSSNNSSNRIIY